MQGMSGMMTHMYNLCSSSLTCEGGECEFRLDLIVSPGQLGVARILKTQKQILGFRLKDQSSKAVKH